MDKQTILDALENPEGLERELTRRDALRSSGMLGAGLALASMPVVLAATAKRAFGQGAGLPNKIVNVLNFALVLEYLEADFYRMGLEAPGLIPEEDRAIFGQISKHETAHVAYLAGALGAKAAIRPTWDFTAGGQFAPFSNYEQFMLLAQGFEDTGVRAYKGQAGFLAENDEILTVALRIHSVEARHASEVRRLRGLKGWIPFDQPEAPAALAAVYAGEDNLVHLGINVGDFEGDQAGTEAFDEPLNAHEVLTIASLFGTGPRRT